ncbi:MAG: hypothetical protein QMD25_04010 [Caldisericia bacterium]|nr:hypothetical protein [Caldisericia bacterium]
MFIIWNIVGLLKVKKAKKSNGERVYIFIFYLVKNGVINIPEKILKHHSKGYLSKNGSLRFAEFE